MTQLTFDIPASPALQVPDSTRLGVDDLAQEIRRVDGNHGLGAGALAEALMPFLTRHLAAPENPKTSDVTVAESAARDLGWLQGLQEAIAICHSERVSEAEPMASDDVAYNNALSHAAKSIGILASRPAPGTDPRQPMLTQAQRDLLFGLHSKFSQYLRTLSDPDYSVLQSKGRVLIDGLLMSLVRTPGG